jgi:hypothetical protein
MMHIAIQDADIDGVDLVWMDHGTEQEYTGAPA